MSFYSAFSEADTKKILSETPGDNKSEVSSWMEAGESEAVVSAGRAAFHSLSPDRSICMLSNTASLK